MRYFIFSLLFVAPISLMAATFERPLSLGSSGPDVSTLQSLLIEGGYLNYPSATGFFGPLTQEAVRKFQVANNLTPLGSVGPGTRSILNSVSAPPSPSATFQPDSLVLSRYLYEGYSGSDVSALQQYLKSLGLFTYPSITGYFGPATREAVQGFQRAFGITPNGAVGPATTARLAGISVSSIFQLPTTSFLVSSQGTLIRRGGGKPSSPRSTQEEEPAPTPDTTSPIISAISSGTPLATSVTITWTTDEAATSQVNYGTSSSYTATSTLNATLTTNHSVEITGLSGETEYHFRVRSTDSAGNLTVSEDQTFTTASPYTTESQAFFARLETEPDTERKEAYDELISTLVDEEIWDELDVFYVLAAADKPTALTNLVSSSYEATANADATFTADRGFTGENASASWVVDSNYNPTTASGNYTQNDAMVFGWDSGYTASGQALLGAVSGGNFDKLELYNGRNVYGRLNDDTEPLSKTWDTFGLFALDRSASGSYRHYQQGILMKTQNISSTGVPNSDVQFINAGFPKFVGAGGIGASLTASQHLVLQEAIEEYMDAVGAPTIYAHEALSPTSMEIIDPADEPFVPSSTVESTTIMYGGELIVITFPGSSLEIRRWSDGELLATPQWGGGGSHYATAYVVGSTIHLFGIKVGDDSKLVHSTMTGTWQPTDAVEFYELTDGSRSANLSVTSNGANYILSIENLDVPGYSNAVMTYLSSNDLENWSFTGYRYDPEQYLGSPVLYYRNGVYYQTFCVSRMEAVFMTVAKSTDLETWVNPTNWDARTLGFPALASGNNNNQVQLSMVEDGNDLAGVFLDGNQVDFQQLRRIKYNDTTMVDLFEWVIND